MIDKNLAIMAFAAMVVLLLTGCPTELKPDRRRIDDELQHKLDRYVRKKTEECYQRVLKRAELDVDSVLIEQARLQKIEREGRQLLDIKPPERPEVPDF